MSEAETCPDGHQYSVSTIKSQGEITTSYCKGGTASPLGLLAATSVTTQVLKGSEVDSFTVKVAPRGKCPSFIWFT